VHSEARQQQPTQRQQLQPHGEKSPWSGVRGKEVVVSADVIPRQTSNQLQLTGTHMLLMHVGVVAHDAAAQQLAVLQGNCQCEEKQGETRPYCERKMRSRSV
jgi:hypothetical protein